MNMKQFELLVQTAHGRGMIDIAHGLVVQWAGTLRGRDVAELSAARFDAASKIVYARSKTWRTRRAGGGGLEGHPIMVGSAMAILQNRAEVVEATFGHEDEWKQRLLIPNYDRKRLTLLMREVANGQKTCGGREVTSRDTPAKDT